MSSRGANIVGAAAIAMAVASAFSCKTFDVPSETCDPAPLHSNKLDDEGSACDSCLEDRCCDLVGVCHGKDGCSEAVHGMHSCVIDAGLQGARYEARCAVTNGLADLHEANDAYRCMRQSCGSECGLPVCQVDEAAVLFQNAKCDQCFAGACCAQLNACYANRACKLMIECVVESCGDALGKALVARSAILPRIDSNDVGARADALCTGPASDFDGPECLRRCLCKYKDNDQGLPPALVEDRAFAVGYRVYACGVAAECGGDCAAGPEDASAP